MVKQVSGVKRFQRNGWLTFKCGFSKEIKLVVYVRAESPGELPLDYLNIVLVKTYRPPLDYHPLAGNPIPRDPESEQTS